MTTSTRHCGIRGMAWLAVLWLAAAGTAHGHGFPLSVHFNPATNRLAVLPYSTSPLIGGLINADGLTVYANFDEEESFAGVDGLYFTDFPGFERAASLPANSTVRIRFVAPLLYWNPATQPGDPLPASNAEIEIVDHTAASAIVDPLGTSGTNPLTLSEFVGQTPGDHKHFTGYLLSTQVDPLTAADTYGLYGLWAAASATGSGFAGGVSQESDPFLIVLNFGIADAGTYMTGVNRLAVTAVPEPSALALAAAGFLAAVGTARRRIRRRGVARRCPDVA